jgi:hypothetical protein
MKYPIRLACVGALLAACAHAQNQTSPGATGEVLFNGIVLPSPWPPHPDTFHRGQPVPPPYLATPPKVIPIDVGRQLFVDDFLIQETTLERNFHTAQYCKDNPVLKPDQAWEQEGGLPSAMPFSDGVWFDPADAKFKMWYLASYEKYTCLAVSNDGVKWEKPDLGVVPKTNIVRESKRDSATVWMDLEEKDPSRRFKMFCVSMPERVSKSLLGTFFSPDGIHWGAPVVENGPVGDRTTVFYNPFRKVWVYSIRTGSGLRSRLYAEQADPDAKAWQADADLSPWTCADALDANRSGHRPELYNLDCIAYESLILGQFTVLHKPTLEAGRPKSNQVRLGFSRDGFHWHRPDPVLASIGNSISVRQVFLPVSDEKGAWNWGNVQSAAGGCLVVGDRLYFYCSGRAGTGQGTTKDDDAAGSTGLAFLRRDGFASMDAPDGGVLTTRPVTFKGRHLFVNLRVPPNGELRVEVLGEGGQPLADYGKDDCLPVEGDRTRADVRWRTAPDLAALAGKTVRFRFHLGGGSLYAFWVSPDASGASYGYVAGGGPGFTGNRDAVGRAADEAAAKITGPTPLLP